MKPCSLMRKISGIIAACIFMLSSLLPVYPSPLFRVMFDVHLNFHPRRRVYDALNVLIAIRVIVKNDKKHITYSNPHMMCHVPTPNRSHRFVSSFLISHLQFEGGGTWSSDMP
jgi:hypothetical protein